MTTPPRTVCLHDKGAIETCLRGNVFLHLYELGDLDERFWPHTTWYGLEEAGRLQATAMVYSGLSEPTLLALGEGQGLEPLVRSLAGLLPRHFNAHLSPGLADILRQDYAVASLGPHYKMALPDPSRLAAIDTSRVAPLTRPDAGRLGRFLSAHSPRSWFHERMLDTGQYFGLCDSEGLLSVAGVHVYSEPYRVAALGNVATHADHRGKGLATATVAALCRNLLRTVDHVGLNVAADNAAAIRCYRRLGFQVIATYEECHLRC